MRKPIRIAQSLFILAAMAAPEPRELKHTYWIDQAISLAGGNIKLDFKAWRYIGSVGVVMWGLGTVFTALGYSMKTPST